MKQFKHVCLLAAVTAVHAGLLYALLAGLLQPAPAPEPPPKEIMATLITPPAPKHEQPPPPTPSKPEPPPPPPKQRPTVERPTPEPAPAEIKPAPQAVSPPTPSPAPAAAAPSPSTEPAPSVPLTPRTVTSGLVILRDARPEMPPLSRRLGEEGTVELRFVVNEQGDAEKIEIKKSSGYPRLDEAARRAILATKFKPYTENGKALPVYGSRAYTFRIDER
ncbi:MAG: energy transducer TonB [Burkholderiales bacterium]|nr:energy transducer TonB [Burkholderiales bacterium]